MRDLLLLFLGWLGAKVRRALPRLVRVAWTFSVRFSPVKRWMLVSMIYTRILVRVTPIAARDDFDPRVKRWIKRIDARIFQS
jgi:hypothetical protein